MEINIFFDSAKRTAAVLSTAVVLCFVSAAAAQPPERAVVTFRAGAYGTLNAAVDGAAIVSGASVDVGKSVVFTAVPDAGYDKVRWWVNGAAMDTSFKYVFVLVIQNAAPKEVVVSFERSSPQYAAVTFRAVNCGTLTATVDGVAITSGDSARIGKSVVFNAVPGKENGAVRWTVKGSELPDTSLYTLSVSVGDAAPIDVAAAFEICAEPPDTSTPPDPPDPPDTSDTSGTWVEPLSGVLTFGPSPLRRGGEVAIYWTGNKPISGALFVFNALGDIAATVNVNGIGKIGAWNTAGAARGTYMMKGMLKDKDGFKCRVLMLIGVVR